ncbi:MAG: hypothetical protein H7A27_00205 [Spirochaetaceae bacterium]|nr:hypothetical protein [Spirochaetaceae bacterium]
MSANGTNGVSPAVRRRRLAVRAGLVLLYFAVGAWVLLNGREHTLLLDNKALADGSAPAFRRVKVYVDRHDPIELYARDRDMIKVRGQGHKIRIETNEGAERLEASFRLAFGEDMFLVSVPAMAKGDDGFCEVFKTADEAPRAEPSADEATPEPTF